MTNSINPSEHDTEAGRYQLIFEKITELAVELGDALDTKSKLKKTVEACREAFDSDVSSISLTDKKGSRINAVTTGAKTKSYMDLEVPPGIGLGALVIKNGEGYISNDYFQDERFDHSDHTDSVWEKEEFKSCMVVPIKDFDHVIGRLWVIKRDLGNFKDSDLKRLNLFGKLISLEISRLNILNVLSSALNLATAITADEDFGSILHDIVSSVRELINTDLVHIGLVDEHKNIIKMTHCPFAKEESFRTLEIPMGEGFGAKAFEDGSLRECHNYLEEYGHNISQPLYDACKAEGIVSGLAMPLKVKNKKVGVLWAFERHERTFRDYDKRTMEIMGKLAAVEIDKSYSHKELSETHKKIIDCISEMSKKDEIDGVIEFYGKTIKDIFSLGVYSEEISVGFYGRGKKYISPNTGTMGAGDINETGNSVDAMNHINKCIENSVDTSCNIKPSDDDFFHKLKNRGTPFRFKCRSLCSMDEESKQNYGTGYIIASDAELSLLCVSWPHDYYPEQYQLDWLTLITKITAAEIFRRLSEQELKESTLALSKLGLEMMK